MKMPTQNELWLEIKNDPELSMERSAWNVLSKYVSLAERAALERAVAWCATRGYVGAANGIAALLPAEAPATKSTLFSQFAPATPPQPMPSTTAESYPDPDLDPVPLTEADVRRIADERVKLACEHVQRVDDAMEKRADAVEAQIHEFDRALTKRMVEIGDKIRALESSSPARWMADPTWLDWSSLWRGS